MPVRNVLSLVLALFLLPACARHETVRSSFFSPAFELVSCRLAAGRDLVDVRLRVARPEAFEPDPVSTYLVDEATGERFYLVQLQRIGPLRDRGDDGKDPVRSITFRNREKMLRPGARLTLVVGEARLRHMVLEE